MTKRFLLWVSLLAFSFLPCTGQAQGANDSAAKQALQENWADAPRSLDERLFDAAVGGEAEAVRQFLQEGADPNAQSCQTHCDVLENCTETEEQNCIIGVRSAVRNSSFFRLCRKFGKINTKQR